MADQLDQRKICKNCIHRTQSKTHLNGGLCNRIVQRGTFVEYINGKLALTSGKEAALASDDPKSWIIVAPDFGCVLYEPILDKPILDKPILDKPIAKVSNEKNISDFDKKISAKMPVQSKVSGTTENHS